jgi:flagellar basal-body rod modification protein FlgD
MATINNTADSQQTLDALLAKLGVKKQSGATAPTAKSQLGQEDFLKLMTAQLQNQDPFQPQSNDQMIAQMAQFSTVTGIQQLNSTMSGVATEIAQNRIATAATFVGRTVLVPGNTALADADGAISGAIDLERSASALMVNIATEEGRLVKSLELGPNAAGLVGFSWDGKDAKGNSVGRDRYVITATMKAGNTVTAANVDVYGPITEARLGTGLDDTTFTVGGAGTVRLSDIKSIKY